MKLGLLTDIHECLLNLDAALDRLSREKVARIILLGDVAETGAHLPSVVSRLRAANVTGVYGNHDLGLSPYPDEELLERFGAEVRGFFAGLSGRLTMADCAFAHAQPWMDPADLEQPWYTSDRPDHPTMLARSFAARAERVMMLGHYHCWLAATPAGRVAWDGGEPIDLAPPGRFLVVLHAVLDGWCASYDTDSGRLTPLRIGPGLRPGD